VKKSALLRDRARFAKVTDKDGEDWSDEDYEVRLLWSLRPCHDEDDGADDYKYQGVYQSMGVVAKWLTKALR
jgi:hypothetical protein